jgi:hypothetical protein
MERIVHRENRKRTALAAAALTLMLSACGTSTIKPVTTFEAPGYEDASYSNLLVIGVAGSYDTRANFERSMASRLNASGAAGTAYYSVIGRNKEITRSDVSDAVRARGFDAVVLTRIVSQESTVVEQRGASTAKATRRDAESPIDLFRYDYEVLNNPSQINVASTVVLSTEIFSAADEKRVYAMETTISDKENVALLVDHAVEEIVAHLRKDGIIGK